MLYEVITHAAEHLVLVEDRHLVPELRELVGAGQPGGAAADHRDALAGGLGRRRVGSYNFV